MNTVPAIAGMNFSSFNPQGRTAAITRNERENFDAATREKLHERAIAPLKPEFSIQAELTRQTDHGTSFLTNSLDFQKQVKNLKSRLELYNMDEVFTMYEIDEATGLPVPSPGTTNLLESYALVSLEKAQANSKMYFGYGDKVIGENLLWSKELILKSCDKELKEKIETQMANLAPHHDTGIVAFHLLASCVVSTSDKVARAIVTKLSTMKLGHFEGEDVQEMAAVVKGAASRLKTCGKLPNDMEDIVREILESAGTFKFRNLFETLSATGSPIMDDWERMLDKAVLVYQDLWIRGKWAPLKKGGASFVANFEASNYSPDIHETSTVGAGSGSFAAAATNGRFIRTHDAKGNAIDRNPPPAGGPTTRVRGDKQEHWCSKCDWGTGRWGNHPDNDHEAFVDKVKARMRKKKERRTKDSDESSAATTTKPSEATTMRQTRFDLPPEGGNAHLAGALTLSRVGTYSSPF